MNTTIEQLKQSILAAIRRNQAQEITGPILQTILLLIVDTLNSLKQDELSAGTGISITDGVITCTLDTTIFVFVQQLPATGVSNKIYFVPSQDPGQQNVYIEYAWVNNAWEKMGEFKAEIDLTPYFLKSNVSQSRGTSTTMVMSQKAISDALTTIETQIGEIDTALDAILGDEE